MTKAELVKEAKDYASKKVPKAELPNLWNIFFKSYLEAAETREKQIAELEKKNKRLKEKLEHRNCVDCSNHGSNMKLLKAKELLKDLVYEYYDFCRLHGFPTEFNCVGRAEQFLKEE